MKKGDTLSKIALLNNTNSEELAKLNSITDPARLKEGMKIKIPVKLKVHDNSIP
ncbi:MAG: LysM domain-containing protein [Victivallales bacterium]